MDPVEICIDIYGSCSCLLAGREPCEKMLELAEEGVSANDERERIAEAAAEAVFDCT